MDKFKAEHQLSKDVDELRDSNDEILLSLFFLSLLESASFDEFSSCKLCFTNAFNRLKRSVKLQLLRVNAHSVSLIWGDASSFFIHLQLKPINFYDLQPPQFT